MPIRILDAATVGRIAAGEVVERPSSVVKELMENSIDAGATSITVEIRGGGIDYLRVTDNGCGIEPGQVRLAFENHATSKLQNADQLTDIRTLGFRGEALPSIASVAHVEMTTRARNQDTGMKLNVDGGENLRVREAGCPEGTTFIMKDLFFNLPVRRAFLKKPNYEGGLVSDAVARMILGNPGISMRFINNGSNVYHSFGDGKLRHAVFAVYGKAVAEKMIELDASEGATRIYGLIGVGELARPTRAHQMFFINGRVVRCPLLSRALEEVCRTRVTIGMYPMCALNIVIPPTGVDVNVHPNKLEVRFRDEAQMRLTAERLMASAFVGEKVLQLGQDRNGPQPMERVATVREILSSPVCAEPAAAQADLPVAEKSPLAARDGHPTLPEAKPLEAKAEQINLFQKELDREIKKFETAGKGELRECPEASSASQAVSPSPIMPPAPRVVEAQAASPVRAQAVPSINPVPEVAAPVRETVQATSTPAGAAPKEPASDGRPYRIIGILLKTYILVEADDALLLIDQHAAHERLQYEKYIARLEAGAASQQLLTPLILHLSAREMALIQENQEALSEAGYTVEPFGELDIQVRAVPYLLGRAELRPMFMELINSLNRLKNATLDMRRAEIMQMACKSAVKAGDRLSDSEVEALIQEMLVTDAPPTCPHGRPVMKAISRRELEKMFKRIQ